MNKVKVSQFYANKFIEQLWDIWLRLMACTMATLDNRDVWIRIGCLRVIKGQRGLESLETYSAYMHIVNAQGYFFLASYENKEM